MSVPPVSAGLSGISGYDFSGIVNSLVSLYKLPEKAMIASQTKLQTTSNAWKDVNIRMAALEATLTGLSDSTAWTATKVTSSNSNILTATTGINVTPGIYSIKVMNTALAQSVTSAVQAVSSPTVATTLNAGTFSITTAGISSTITVLKDDSLQTIANSINNNSSGVSATVIPVIGGYQLTISSKQTGVANAASFSNVTGTVLTDLGITDAFNVLKPSQVVQTATNALLTVNGVANVTSATNSITSVIPGVTLNINGSDAGVTTTTLNITADGSASQGKIQSFIDQYNSTMSFIDSKMSYDSVTKKAGDLFGDQTLQGIQDKLRSMMSSSFNNTTKPYLNLSSIGITTSADNYGASAALTFDIAKFATAMAANPNSVANMFGAAAGGVTPSIDPKNPQGLANVLESYLHPMIMYGGSFALQQTGYGKLLDGLKNQISAFEVKATAYQVSQKAKFAALETALAALTSQGASLTGMINSLNAQTTVK